MRRTLGPLFLAGLAACATTGGRAGRPAIAADGRTAIVGGQALRSPEGVFFFERDGAVHVVSLVPGQVFDVALRTGPEGGSVVPQGAPFDVREGAIVLRELSLPPTARLVETGQLYRHEDHFHLTHRWENDDWRALYRARGEDSGLPPSTRQVAAFALATLLDLPIPGGDEQGTARALRRATETVARTRRAVEGQLPAKQTMAMVLHDFEILDGGRALAIEQRVYRAGEGVRFSYCGDHFHVADGGGAWEQPVPLADAEPGSFTMPPSMFFEVVDGTVSPRADDAAWRRLAADGEVHFAGDGWFVTERYARPSFARLRKASSDPAVPLAQREAARRSVLEFLRIRLDVESDAAFRARLAAIDQAMDRRWRELEGRIGAAGRKG